MNTQYVLSVLVNNNAGVLYRISGLYSRRGYNIDSLTVSTTDVPGISRITIVVRGDDYILEQITKQLMKLEDVKKVEHLRPEQALFRELLLLKVSASMSTRSSIKEAAEIFRARILDMNPDSMVIELTGQQSKNDAFLEIMQPYGILEMCRTGITAMGRGTTTIHSDEQLEGDL